MLSALTQVHSPVFATFNSIIGEMARALIKVQVAHTHSTVYFHVSHKKTPKTTQNFFQE